MLVLYQILKKKKKNLTKYWRFNITRKSQNPPWDHILRYFDIAPHNSNSNLPTTGTFWYVKWHICFLYTYHRKCRTNHLTFGGHHIKCKPIFNDSISCYIYKAPSSIKFWWCLWGECKMVVIDEDHSRTRRKLAAVGDCNPTFELWCCKKKKQEFES